MQGLLLPLADIDRLDMVVDFNLFGFKILRIVFAVLCFKIVSFLVVLHELFHYDAEIFLFPRWDKLETPVVLHLLGDHAQPILSWFVLLLVDVRVMDVKL